MADAVGLAFDKGHITVTAWYMFAVYSIDVLYNVIKKHHYH